MNFDAWLKHCIPNFAIAMLLACVAGTAQAMSDDQQIAQQMLIQFDTPETPLNVVLIVVVGDRAIAGWMQGGRGGRALLRKNDKDWEIYMCGGADLTSPAFLMQAGMDSATAYELAKVLAAAEQKLPADQRKQLSRFEGAINVPTGEHAGHYRE